MEKRKIAITEVDMLTFFLLKEEKKHGKHRVECERKIKNIPTENAQVVTKIKTKGKKVIEESRKNSTNEVRFKAQEVKEWENVTTLLEREESTE